MCKSCYWLANETAKEKKSTRLEHSDRKSWIILIRVSREERVTGITRKACGSLKSVDIASSCDEATRSEFEETISWDPLKTAKVLKTF